MKTKDYIKPNVEELDVIVEEPILCASSFEGEVGGEGDDDDIA